MKTLTEATAYYQDNSKAGKRAKRTQQLNDTYPVLEPSYRLISDAELESTKAFDIDSYEVVRARQVQECADRMTQRILLTITDEIFRTLHTGMRMEDIHLAVRSSVNAFQLTITDEVIREVILEKVDLLAHTRRLDLL